MSVVTRFAPSPTGYLHVGGLRTALYSYLYARQKDGNFLLRIEDTDRDRYVQGATEDLIETLNRVGLTYDEGPMIEDGEVVDKGDRGPYIQSKRTDRYKKYANELLEQGNAYHCFCSKERLESLRKQQELAKLPTKYDRRCLDLSEDEVKTKLSANEPHVIRLKIPDGQTAFKDVIRGNIIIKNEELDDQVLLKSDGFPTYHLANIVDDHLMGVSDVIRGEEWLSSTPKHVIMYDMLNWEMPNFAHLPLILNEDKSKLSKRQGDVAVEDYLAKGYLPEALINFVALLGFNPRDDREIYTMDELIEEFDLTKVNKGGAVFDREKLAWMNGQYIRKKDLDELVKMVKPFIDEAGKEIEDDFLKKICTVEQERLELLGDVVDLLDGYQNMPKYESSLLVWRKSDAEGARKNLQNLIEYIENEMSEADFADIEHLETEIFDYIKSNDLGNGDVLWPMRAALSGRSASPSPFELAWVFSKRGTVERLKHGVDKLEQ